jgi:phage replication-related protein YjqB (UPF0714/DUF867 family)
VERAKGQVRLGWHPAEADDVHSKRPGTILRKLEQRGFSDACFATEDQRGTAVTNTINQPVNKGNIVLAPTDNR